MTTEQVDPNRPCPNCGVPGFHGAMDCIATLTAKVDELKAQLPPHPENDPTQMPFKDACNHARDWIGLLEKKVREIKKHPECTTLALTADTKGEMLANITLSFRHLEDARMRLGKAIQAYEGGVSILDKWTYDELFEHGIKPGPDENSYVTEEGWIARGPGPYTSVSKSERVWAVHTTTGEVVSSHHKRVRNKTNYGV